MRRLFQVEQCCPEPVELRIREETLERQQAELAKMSERLTAWESELQKRHEELDRRAEMLVGLKTRIEQLIVETAFDRQRLAVADIPSEFIGLATTPRPIQGTGPCHPEASNRSAGKASPRGWSFVARPEEQSVSFHPSSPKLRLLRAIAKANRAVGQTSKLQTAGQRQAESSAEPTSECRSETAIHANIEVKDRIGNKANSKVELDSNSPHLVVDQHPHPELQDTSVLLADLRSLGLIH